jgi:polyhydroxyalkanoate synthesis regulator phasin
MTNPLIRAFFLGRATAEVLYEELEHQLTDTLSNVGKFDAEQREKLRQFTNQVMTRAEAEAAHQPQTYAVPTGGSSTTTSPDLQETIDELRAEIAQLRSALQNYRSHSG